jgi:rhodanese-related sulfurtransferase
MQPHTRTTVGDLLAEARAQLRRATPAEADRAAAAGAVLVDIRSDSQLAADGLVPGARHISRNVLEWRLDPSCEHRDGDCTGPGLRVILICDEGYQSSLAAATLRRFGVDATDVEGGFQAWRADGLPVEGGGE